ncbi:MAG TPA: GGDEF domain-containing protein [Thermosulfurimonas dismutans]|uniref:diguanylate cyclase n=1 Tax=Thermosulfurimonas dismutans TaxID=999894 RepID=A0A7C3CFD0_9BACT|nr:GGDEF domain-containing protein [Thermosulfurimonas dismutans]
MATDAFSEFLEREADRLRTCWAAFLSPFREQQLPLPPRYAEEFRKYEPLSPGEKKNTLVEILRETREVLNWLLLHVDIRDKLAQEGRLGALEELLHRLEELERQVDYLREELLRDPLTGLWNRRALNIFFPEVIRRITEGRELYVMVFLDIYGFKEVNHRYGHQAGDQVLIRVANRLRTLTKRVDMPVRIGGDEFILLLAAPSLDRVAPFLLELAGTPIRIEDLEKYLACGATDILGTDTLESCLHRADLAMYKHKLLLRDWLAQGGEGPFPTPVLLRAYSRDM